MVRYIVSVMAGDTVRKCTVDPHPRIPDGWIDAAEWAISLHQDGQTKRVELLSVEEYKCG